MHGCDHSARNARHLCLGAFVVAIVAASTANAVMVELLGPDTSGSIATNYGTAFFTTDTTHPTGTGVFDPFLSIQRNGVEQGYNTSNNHEPFDAKRVSQWNHEFTVAEMKAGATVQIGNETFFRFLIDINEPNARNATDEKPLISLDSLKMFTSTIAGQTTSNVDSLGTKRFDIDIAPGGGAADNWVLYDDRNHGSGQSDIAFLIPTSAFAGAADSDYVYMYQHFGQYASADGVSFDTAGGFEETRFGGAPIPGSPVIPEASTVVPLAGILGIALATECFRRRRRGEPALR